MSLITPPLKRAEPGEAITAGGWNSLVAGIEGLDAAAGMADLDYVEIAVTSRGERVANAQVVGAPAGGRPRVAVAPIGDLVDHTLVGVRKGRWSISIQAPGFTTETRDIDVQATPAARGPSASLAVELKRATVPAPDLLAMPVFAARWLAGWAHLPLDEYPATIRDTDVARYNSAVVIQGAIGAQLPRGSTINMAYWGMWNVLSPTRTVVPDFLGWPASELAQSSQEFLMDIYEDSLRPPGARVTTQSVAPGESFTPYETLHVSYQPRDASSGKFGTYPGTHPSLADRLVKEVADAIGGHAPLQVPGLKLAPWPVARTYVTDELLTAVLDVFATFEARVSDPAIDLEAIWRSFLVATHWSTPAEGTD